MNTYMVQGADGNSYGPADQQTLQQWARHGRIAPHSLLKNVQTGEQAPASSHPFLMALFQNAAPPQPGVGAYPQYYGGPQAYAPQPYAPQPYGPVGYVNPNHQLTTFSVPLVVLLHLVTFGIFSVIHFGLMHDKMPQLRHDDPSGGKAIGFMFIPFFNWYWMFFCWRRLSERVAEQRHFRGMPADSLVTLATITCVFHLIPYLNVLVGMPIMGSIFFAMLQAQVNELVERGPSTGFPVQHPMAMR